VLARGQVASRRLPLPVVNSTGSGAVRPCAVRARLRQTCCEETAGRTACVTVPSCPLDPECGLVEPAYDQSWGGNTSTIEADAQDFLTCFRSSPIECAKQRAVLIRVLREHLYSKNIVPGTHHLLLLHVTKRVLPRRVRHFPAGDATRWRVYCRAILDETRLGRSEAVEFGATSTARSE